MIVNKSTIEGITTNFNTLFNKAFSTTQTTWQDVAMQINSTTKQNTYVWVSAFPMLREWIGEKKLKNLEEYEYTIKNKSYEATIEVQRDDIEDDLIGNYNPAVQGAGMAAKQLPDKLVYDIVNKGFISKCYDGQYFFDEDHQVNKESVSNKGTKALSINSLAAAQASFGAARTAMSSLTNDEGEPLSITPNILLVPPALQDIANTLMTAERLEDGKNNIYRNAAKVIVSQRITSPTAWFLLDTTKPVRPFIYQNRKSPIFVQQTTAESDDVFMKGSFKYGVEARGNAGFGLWQFAYGSTGAE